MARAVSPPFTMTIDSTMGGVLELVPVPTPPASQPVQALVPNRGQGWGCIVANHSAFNLQVTSDESGSKWVPAFTADRFQGCEVCRLHIRAVDPNPPAGSATHTGLLLLSWAIEADSFDGESYPHPV